jgi:hypothetical protein
LRVNDEQRAKFPVEAAAKTVSLAAYLGAFRADVVVGAIGKSEVQYNLV